MTRNQAQTFVGSALDVSTASIEELALTGGLHASGIGSYVDGATVDTGVFLAQVTTGNSNATLTLPSATDTGRVVVVVKADAGSGNIAILPDPIGISGFTLIGQGDSAIFMSNGVGWYSIGKG